MSRMIQSTLSMLGVLATESLKMSLALTGGLLGLTTGIAALSAVFGDTSSLVVAVEGVFLMFGVMSVFAALYVASRKATATVSNTSYQTTKRRVP